MDAHAVALHHQRIMAAVQAQGNPQFPILETCRLDNRRIQPLGQMATPATELKGIQAFIPAAGASSRYTRPLQDWIRTAAAVPRPAWALPNDLRELTLPRVVDMQRRAMPKALMPCVQEGITYLEMKFAEHAAMSFIDGEVYVVPEPFQEEFSAIARRSSIRPVNPLFLPQGRRLSTLRFSPTGVPMRNPDGTLSIVPAGHGALANLFPSVKGARPECQTLFIRNLDNVTGTGAEIRNTCEAFLREHAALLAKVIRIRAHLRVQEIAAANALAVSVLNAIALRSLESDEAAWIEVQEPATRNLWVLQFLLFQTPVWKARTSSLEALYKRPVNSMGMVPNLGNDIGGAPVIVNTDNGPLALCIEVPHVSPSDQRSVLMDAQRATHFNPVFVAAELPESDPGYDRGDNPFWILAEKSWNDQKVLYHETLLYELLGNCDLSNAVFFHVPRHVFNPHKTIDDTIGKKFSDWA